MLIILVVSAIFNTKLNSTLGSSIAAAVLPLGFPPQELEAFIGALAGQDKAALAQLPGVTPQIIGAGVHALQTSFLESFKNVWIAAAVFSGVTVIGKNPLMLISLFKANNFLQHRVSSSTREEISTITSMLHLKSDKVTVYLKSFVQLNEEPI